MASTGKRRSTPRRLSLVGDYEGSVGGESLAVGGHRPQSFGRGRVCMEPRCGTQLSIYNPGDYCSLHQPMEEVRIRGVPEAS